MPEITDDMIYPHLEDGTKLADVWVKCSKCNGARHRVLPGDETPFWYCQDNIYRLEPNQEVEVEYLDGNNQRND